MKRDKDHSAHYEKLKADVLDLKGYAAELAEKLESSDAEADEDFYAFVCSVITEMNDLLAGIARGRVIMPFKPRRLMCYHEAIGGIWENPDTTLTCKIRQVQDSVTAVNRYISTGRPHRLAPLQAVYLVALVAMSAFAVCGIFVNHAAIYVLQGVFCITFLTTMFVSFKRPVQDAPTNCIIGLYNIDYKGGKITATDSIFSHSEDIAVVTFANGYSLDLGFSHELGLYVITAVKNNDWQNIVEERQVRRVYDLGKPLQELIVKYGTPIEIK